MNKFEYHMELLVLEAWTVFRSDIKYGNSMDFGNFDMCKSIHHKSEDGETISGQYCLVQFRTSRTVVGIPPKRSLFNYGWKDMDTRMGSAVCIPASCPPEIVHPLMEEVFRGTEYEMVTDYDQERYCKRPSEPFRVTGSMIGLGCVVAALFVLGSYATLYDLETSRNKQKDRNRLLLCFSFYSNARSLFSVEEEKSADSIGCLHGIRVASTLTIILFHSYYHRVMYPIQQSEETSSFLKSSSERMVIALMTTVESFFVLSGFLAFRSIVRDLDK
jgi:Nose resistant-to-fluoxetine protein, N-terminal domain